MIQFRKASLKDVPALARIRAMSWETEEYWQERISGYLNSELNPQKALQPRIIYLAFDNAESVGLIAGHLTTRFDCDGELEWIDVIPAYRRRGIASDLLKLLADWFNKHNARRICVDPGNDNAREFYRNNGAIDLNKHWMVWEDVRKVNGQ